MRRLTKNEFLVFWGSAIVCGLLLGVANIIGAHVGGHTFGQRCEAAGYTGEQFSECVSHLADGGNEETFKKEQSK